MADRKEVFKKAVAILEAHMTRDEFIEFANCLEEDPYYTLDDVVNERLFQIAPHLFGTTD